jgi:hypothetical protein
MARIYRITDRIRYKIGELEIQISPLDLQDKTTLHTYMVKGQTGDMQFLMQGSAFAIKCGVKAVLGLEDADGKPYEVQFEEGGKYLTDECVADLLNIRESNDMISLCASLMAGVPSQLPQGVTLSEDSKKSPNARAKK